MNFCGPCEAGVEHTHGLSGGHTGVRRLSCEACGSKAMEVMNHDSHHTTLKCDDCGERYYTSTEGMGGSA